MVHISDSKFGTISTKLEKFYCIAFSRPLSAYEIALIYQDLPEKEHYRVRAEKNYIKKHPELFKEYEGTENQTETFQSDVAYLMDCISKRFVLTKNIYRTIKHIVNGASFRHLIRYKEFYIDSVDKILVIFGILASGTYISRRYEQYRIAHDIETDHIDIDIVQSKTEVMFKELLPAYKEFVFDNIVESSVISVKNSLVRFPDNVLSQLSCITPYNMLINPVLASSLAFTHSTFFK